MAPGSPMQPVGPSAPYLRGSSPVPDLSLSRLSSQDRLNGILETARERADTIGSQASGRSPRMSVNFQRLSGRDDDDCPDETTSITNARDNTPNYQGTRISPSPRNRRPAQQSGTDNTPTNATNGTNGAGHRPDEKSWLKHCFSGLWSVELENKGSVARDHLALERTFLAWLRTSLSFASIGIAITQLFRLNTSIDTGDDPNSETIRRIGKPLGATFIGISILILLLGYRRYYQGQQWVIKGKFPASRGTIVIVSIVACAIIVVSLFVVIFTQPSSVTSR
ncbi:uncharacterized protein F4807DRAFT_409864 [Annulohypoxylon truncatum]|uniref:uncharacterized protein n=1 Tax=Annulohypoxylon truncatum TaxID=327061 RepID=UPI002008B2CF|nr:uncharacterized protein F4807DRAFT_409864 [Annulohypoxylon truncatum]KAI1213943.1 hypothetical protein F4807DRAFT_409864 [Annulohypoxylon truncatum]